MKLYSAFIRKNNSNKIQDIILLKEGFSFLALFFNGLWFFYHKMWREFFALILVNISFAFFGEVWHEFDKVFLEIALVIAIAINANYWLSEHLRNSGYEFAGMFFGDNLAEAQFNFSKSFGKNYDINMTEFDDSILNPKLHRKLMRSKRK